MQPITLTIPEITAWLGSFFWPFVRIAAMFSIAPVIGGRQIPAQIKIAAAILVTLSVLPLQQAVPEVAPWSAIGVYITAQQMLIGLVMGFILTLVFAAMNIAGHSIGMSMGLGFSLAVDPNNGVQVPIISQFFSITATLLFLSLNGHLALISTMASSFEYLPVASEGIRPDGLWQLIKFSSIMFAGALSVALPAIIALLMANLVMGVMTRSAPQMNIFSIGFPMTMMAGFTILIFTLPNMLSVFERLMDESFLAMLEVLK